MDIYFQQTAQPMVIYFTGGFNFNSYIVGGGGLVADGNYGDITVNGAGSNWIINTGVVESGNLAARNVTFDKLPEIGAYKFLGRHNGTAGDIQEIGIDGGLEFHGGNLRRSAITGDININAGSNVSTLSTGVVSTSILGGDITTAGKALLNAIDTAAQRDVLELGTAAIADSSAFESSGTVNIHALAATGVHGISPFAATILDDLSASAVRATLELGTASIAAASDFAATSHTHSLSNLTQSGAILNQIIQWNGTEWVPVTFSGGIGGTLGSTDNALTRADGTGGTTAQGSGVTLDDLTNLSATNWTVGVGTYSGRTFSKFCSVGSNIALVLAPTGTGFICATVPDGTTAGGNNRGVNAVDLQTARVSAGRVASGDYSTIGGGFHNVVTALYGTVAGGRSNDVSGENGFASGRQNTVSGLDAVGLGYLNTVSGTRACVPGGAGNTASGSHSCASGLGAIASLYGQYAEASGNFSLGGDAQRGRITARRATTDATPSNLFLDGSSARWVVPANSSGSAMVTIVARTATAGGQTMTWRRRVNWQRGVGLGTVTIDVETIGTDRGYTGGAWGAGPAWSLAITPDTTNGGINVIGTGAAATNIRWIAEAQWGEITFA